MALTMMPVKAIAMLFRFSCNLFSGVFRFMENTICWLLPTYWFINKIYYLSSF
jgi:hypothetical protein